MLEFLNISLKKFHLAGVSKILNSHHVFIIGENIVNR